MSVATRNESRSVAAFNNSNTEDWDRIEKSLTDGAVDLLLLSPERFNYPDFRDRLLGPLARSAGLLVIDEAHCISDWGHDFRPDYRRLVRVLELMRSGIPVLCTTATANDRVVADIRHPAVPRAHRVAASRSFHQTPCPALNPPSLAVPARTSAECRRVARLVG